MAEYMIVTMHSDEVSSGFASLEAAKLAAQEIADRTGRVLYVAPRDGEGPGCEINPRGQEQRAAARAKRVAEMERASKDRDYARGLQQRDLWDHRLARELGARPVLRENEETWSWHRPGATPEDIDSGAAPALARGAYLMK